MELNELGPTTTIVYKSCYNLTYRSGLDAVLVSKVAFCVQLYMSDDTQLLRLLKKLSCDTDSGQIFDHIPGTGGLTISPSSDPVILLPNETLNLTCSIIGTDVDFDWYRFSDSADCSSSDRQKLHSATEHSEVDNVTSSTLPISRMMFAQDKPSYVCSARRKHHITSHHSRLADNEHTFRVIDIDGTSGRTVSVGSFIKGKLFSTNIFCN